LKQFTIDPKFCYNVFDSKLVELSEKKKQIQIDKQKVASSKNNKVDTFFQSNNNNDKSTTLSKKPKKEQEIKKLVTTTNNNDLSKLDTTKNSKSDNVELINTLKVNNGAMDDVTQSNKSLKISIGMHVKKYFEGHGYFHGIVKAHKEEYFKIAYDDGDEEELTENEVLKIICNGEEKRKDDVVKKRKHSLSKNNTKRLAKRKVCRDSDDDEENEFCFDDNNEKEKNNVRLVVCESDDEDN